jgi:hypothetical protein
MAPPKTKNGLTEYSFELSVSGEMARDVFHAGYGPLGGIGVRFA